MQDVEAAWADVQDFAQRSGLRIFPGMLKSPPRAVVQAIWPNDDWQAFVTLAVDLEIDILYAARFVFDGVERTKFERSLGSSDDPIAEVARADARSHTDDPFSVQIAFVHAGVLHIFEAQEDWYINLERTSWVEEEVEEARWEAERAEEERELDSIEQASADWARGLAESLKFFRAPNEKSRRLAAAELIPALGRFLNREGSNRAYSRALRVVEAADRIARDEVIPHKKAELRARPEALANSVALDPDFQSATTKGDRQRVVRALLQDQLGFSDPGLVALIEQVARGADR